MLKFLGFNKTKKYIVKAYKISIIKLISIKNELDPNLLSEYPIGTNYNAIQFYSPPNFPRVAISHAKPHKIYTNFKPASVNTHINTINLGSNCCIYFSEQQAQTYPIIIELANETEISFPEEVVWNNKLRTFIIGGISFTITTTILFTLHKFVFI